jgi:hypothetical protein
MNHPLASFRKKSTLFFILRTPSFVAADTVNLQNGETPPRQCAPLIDFPGR